ELAAPLIVGAELQRESIAARLELGYLDATTLMEYLMQSGIPQRTAHHLVGTLVRRAMELRVSLAELPLEEYKQQHADLDQGVYEVLGVEKAVQAFRSYGSTAPVEVRRQIDQWQQRIAAEN